MHGCGKNRREGVRQGDLPAGDLGPMGIIHGGGIPAVRAHLGDFEAMERELNKVAGD